MPPFLVSSSLNCSYQGTTRHTVREAAALMSRSSSPSLPSIWLYAVFPIFLFGSSSTAIIQPRSPQQQKTWEFLKAKRLVGKKKLFKPYDGAGSEKTEAEEYAFAQQQSKAVTEAITDAWRLYGEAEREEKRNLKKKILAGEELAEEERRRLDELKALNKALKDAESKAEGPVLKKTRLAFRACNITGQIDRMNENFPCSSIGTEWRRTSGEGSSEFYRSVISTRPCNLLRVKGPSDSSSVSSGSAVRLTLDLSNELPPGTGTVDANAFSGIEVRKSVFPSPSDPPPCCRSFRGTSQITHSPLVATKYAKFVCCIQHTQMDIWCPRCIPCSLILTTPGQCEPQVIDYRANFETKALTFANVKVPWSEFRNEAVASEMDVTRLRRLSIELLSESAGDVEEIALGGLGLF